MERETEETKKILEEIKGKWESMKQMVENHSRLKNNFDSAIADAAKIIETLKDSLKVFEQQRIEKAKEKLKSIKDRLPQVITTLGAIKNEAKSKDNFHRYVDFALKYAGQLNEALEVALKPEEKAINIKYLKEKAGALWTMGYNIGLYEKNSQIADEWQQSAYATEVIRKTLVELQV